MKKRTQTQKNIWIIILCFGCSIILNSCISNTNKNDKKAEVTSLKLGTCTVNKALTKTWDYLRLQENHVKTIFNKSGNKFSFTRNTKRVKDSIFYALTGYSKQKKQLSFTVVKSKNGKPQDLTCIATANVNSKKVHLPKYKPTHEGNPDAITWEEANTRINNWRNDKKRNVWVRERFKAVIDPSEAIFYAFYIHNIDFKYGVKHDCYLALKEDITDSGITYSADLIIVNTKTKKTISLLNSEEEEDGNIEDLTAPVPPFVPPGRE